MSPGSPAPRPGRPDAIVVGAGIAGLVAATELAARGHEVLVLEHGHQAGGLMAGMRRRGFHFDVGCQSFEDMGILFPLLEGYGLSDLARSGTRTTGWSCPGSTRRWSRSRRSGRSSSARSPTGPAPRARLRPSPAHLRPPRTPLRPRARAVRARRAGAAAGRSAPSRAATRSPRALLGHLRDLRTLLLEDFGRWYERELPPSAARDLLSRCGYTRMNVFVASAFWHLWAHDYWYPEGGLQGFFDRWVARLSERGVLLPVPARGLLDGRGGGRAGAVRDLAGRAVRGGRSSTRGTTGRSSTGSSARRVSAAAVTRLEGAQHSDALVSVYLGLDIPTRGLRERLGRRTSSISRVRLPHRAESRRPRARTGGPSSR